MSNYRRLISYIYAYEGGVKGKNIGFAKLETRNGQCRIQVSVRKVFLGSQDMGVFLLSTGSEIFLGRIFLRNGAGEFRTSVAVEHVAGSDQNIDQCYGLTIHNIDDSWQNYTTIWEDAVAHAAEVELEEAVSELAEEQEMSQVPESALSEKKLEEVVANHKSSIIENIEAEIQAQNQQEKRDVSAQNVGEEIPSTFVQPRKEEPKKIMWPREGDGQTTEQAPDMEAPMEERQPHQRFEEQHQEEQQENQPERSPQEQLEKELNEEVLETPNVKSESQRMQECGGSEQFEEQKSEQPQERPQQRMQPQSQGQPRQQMFQGCFSRRPVHGMPQQEQYYQEIPLQKRAERQTRQGMPGQGLRSRQMTAPALSMEAAGMMQQPVQPMQSQPPVPPMQQSPMQSVQPQPPVQSVQQSLMQSVQPQPSVPPIQQSPVQSIQQSPIQSVQPQPPAQSMQPSNWEQPPEGEELKEGVDIETLWQRFCRTYPKIQAFDYDGNCEILTIKPQDIGLLPREIWNYGNNSFLLHGYYNHRYLILARLTIPNGGIRFLLGVPGHYYSNEKYMASMFGFPNFVMSKTQPSGDNRFGYWYTDLRLGF